MTMKMRLGIKNRSQRYDINSPRPRHRHKYAKYKMWLSIMMVKQHLSNIWSSIHERLSNTEAELRKKKALLIKKACLLFVAPSCKWLSLLHNFIQQSLNLGSQQVKSCSRCTRVFYKKPFFAWVSIFLT